MGLQEDEIVAKAVSLAKALAAKPPEERIAIVQRSLAALEKMPDSPAKEDARTFLQTVLTMMENPLRTS